MAPVAPLVASNSAAPISSSRVVGAVGPWASQQASADPALRVARLKVATEQVAARLPEAKAAQTEVVEQVDRDLHQATMAIQVRVTPMAATVAPVVAERGVTEAPVTAVVVVAVPELPQILLAAVPAAPSRTQAFLSALRPLAQVQDPKASAEKEGPMELLTVGVNPAPRV